MMAKGADKLKTWIKENKAKNRKKREEKKVMNEKLKIIEKRAFNKAYAGRKVEEAKKKGKRAARPFGEKLKDIGKSLGGVAGTAANEGKKYRAPDFFNDDPLVKKVAEYGIPSFDMGKDVPKKGKGKGKKPEKKEAETITEMGSFWDQ